VARRDKEFAVKLAAAEVSGQQVLRNAVQSEKNLASGGDSLSCCRLVGEK
jgi:hypothetical protein